VAASAGKVDEKNNRKTCLVIVTISHDFGHANVSRICIKLRFISTRVPAVWQPQYIYIYKACICIYVCTPFPIRSRNLVSLSVSWHLINLATTWASKTMPPMYVDSISYLAGLGFLPDIPVAYIGDFVWGTFFFNWLLHSPLLAAISWNLCAFVLRWNINKVADTPKIYKYFMWHSSSHLEVWTHLNS